MHIKFWKQYFYNDKIASNKILNIRLEYVSSELKLFTNSLF